MVSCGQTKKHAVYRGRCVQSEQVKGQPLCIHPALQDGSVSNKLVNIDKEEIMIIVSIIIFCQPSG